MSPLSRLAKYSFGPFALLAAAGPTQAQTVFADGFEAGFAGWTMDSLWNSETATDPCGSQAPPFPTGQVAAYFGNDTSCNFFGVPQGNLTTVAPIAIPNTLMDVKLRFWSYDAVECSSCEWDWRFIYVSDDMGATWDFIGESASYFAWHETELSLGAYKGQDILLRFHFDAVDNVWNQDLGWLIDEVRIELDCDTPSNVCTSLSNSAGLQGRMGWSGSTSVAANDFHITAADTPPNHQGTFFYGSSSTFIVFGNGIQCVGSGATGVFRLPPSAPTDAGGFLSRQIDFNSLPASSGPGLISPGETWLFQFWYRDQVGAGFNLTDALRVQFCP